jgi:sphinganine C4-monooxygenase
MNSTACSVPGCNLDFNPVCPTPWYYSTKPALLPGMSDEVLSMGATIAAYWILSGFFQVLDWSNWSHLDKYRIHDSPEVASRNRATKKEVLVAVIFQQVIQTALGYWWLEGRPGLDLAQHCAAEAAWRPAVAAVLSPFLGPTVADAWAGTGAYWVYWWTIPVAQFIFGMYV